MNPKGINDLDPKLRETYERIMGTSIASSQPAAQTSAQAPAQPAPQPILKTETVAPEPTVQPGAPVTSPLPEMVQSPQVFKASDPFKDIDPPPSEIIAKNGVVAPLAKKKRSLKPVLFVVGGIIFFVVYTLVWAVVLGLIKLS